MNRYRWLARLAVLCLALTPACGGSDDSDEDTGGGGTVNPPAETADAGSGQSAADGGNASEGEQEQGSVDPGSVPACGSDVGTLEIWDGKAYEGSEGYYYDYGGGQWEATLYASNPLSEDKTDYLWIDVNNGEDASASIGPGTYKLGRVDFEDDGGYYICLDQEFYSGASDAAKPAACASFMVGWDVYEMYGGSLKISELSTSRLAGSVENGLFFLWPDAGEGDGPEDSCGVPPISYSFSVDLKLGH